MTRLWTALSVMIALTSAGAAQELRNCDHDATTQAIASAAHLAEPWAENTRSYARGKIRVALLNTTGPEFGRSYLLLLTPSAEDDSLRHCSIIGQGMGGGFQAIDFQAISPHHQGDTGLTLTFPVQEHNPSDATNPVHHKLQVLIDHETHTNSARYAD